MIELTEQYEELLNKCLIKEHKAKACEYSTSLAYLRRDKVIPTTNKRRNYGINFHK